MFLSNPRKSILAIAIVSVLLTACGSKPITSGGVSPVDPTSDRFPFPTREPQEYQGNFVVSDGTSETKYFVARKADKWRFDINSNGSPKTTQVRTDKVYLIDHVNKTYAIEAFADLEDFDTSYFNSLTWGFFRGANYIEYEETGRNGNFISYKAKTLKDRKNDVLISVDATTGILMRQEITSDKDRDAKGAPIRYTYEVRDLKLEVADSVFEIPSGYRSTLRSKIK
ncbi:MAG: hypothetical protein KBF83_03345 [Pyrinomonadaceae bacterium]|nr:hypothetical protein [Pyrinomonadaceae bacterium]